MFNDVLMDVPSHRRRSSDLEMLSFVTFCSVRRAWSYAQRLQDLWVLYETDSMRRGYFVEFGAADGVLHSNSALLERNFEWTGVLAEPNPAQEPALRRNRTARVDMRCVWDTTGDVLELLLPDDPQLATIQALQVDDAHQAARRAATTSVPASTVTLCDLLDDSHAPSRIDYMSVDTEGSELRILSHFDFRSRDIALISIEHNNRADEAMLDELMQANGYERRFAEISAFDAWYRRRGFTP